jgi:N-methylhydantoinase A/oxoprolinase/acetone carboxylase beta subunit
LEIGIDVGGTFTDGVVMNGGQVVNWVKKETGEDIASSIQGVLEQLLAGIDPFSVKRVVLSTTLITNIIAQGRVAPAGLILLPGPGVNPRDLPFAAKAEIIKGAVDYRGRIIEKIDPAEVSAALKRFLDSGISRIAVACKFSQRNPALEEEISRLIEEECPAVRVLASSRVSGLLNWVRRANGAVFSLQVSDDYRLFAGEVAVSMERLGLKCPVCILKADGGTIPLEQSLQRPLEGIFSGPAASTLGALAAGGEGLTSVVMDTGGTTTDLALVLEGRPLFSEKGAFVNGYPVCTRAMAVASLALGGDSTITLENGRVVLGERYGKAMCLGGARLTVTDALVYLGLSDLAGREKILPILEEMSRRHGLEAGELAEKAVSIFLESLERKLEEMFAVWEEEPAYRIWQVISGQKKRPRTVVCLGGPAKGLGILWGKKKGWQVIVPRHAQVANAIGAALSKTTLRLDFFADTQQMIYSTNIGGLHGSLEHILPNLEEAKQFAESLFRQAAKELDMPVSRSETLYEEGFNIIRGWNTLGKIYQIGMQTPPGLRAFLEKGAGTGA